LKLSGWSASLDTGTVKLKLTMKKSIALYTIVAAALIASPAVIRAQDTATNNSPAATAPAKKKGILAAHGKVTAVDAAAMTITVKEQTFNVTSATKITKDGLATTLADIKVDDAVRITYKKDGSGKLNATVIRVGEKKKTE
jgi:hypothetical protein